MADDLGDDWWQEDIDKAESVEENVKKQRGVKRAKPSRDSAGEAASSDEVNLKIPRKTQKGHKVKKGKTRGKFVRKKITGEQEEDLNKGGTPADVRTLLRPSVAVVHSNSSGSESDNEESLSLETDFFPANQGLSCEEYLTTVLPGWQKVVKKTTLTPGSPLILILCSSAIRAVQLNRDMKAFLGKDCKTAKLFAKHMKLEEQKKFLHKNACHAGIGTPNRIQALVEDGCLKLQQLHAVILDWNWRDVKLKRMVDIPDVRRELVLLLKEHALDRIRNTACRIAIM